MAIKRIWCILRPFIHTKPVYSFLGDKAHSSLGITMKFVPSFALFNLLLLVGPVQSVDLAQLTNCLTDGETIQLACDNIDSTATPAVSFEKIHHDGYYVRARLACSGDINVAAVACFLEDEDGGYGVGVASQNADATITPMCFNSFSFNGEVRKYISICLGAEVDENETAGGGGRGRELASNSGASTRVRRAKSSTGSTTGSGKGSKVGGDLICTEPPKPSLWEIRQVLEFVEVDE